VKGLNVLIKRVVGRDTILSNTLGKEANMNDEDNPLEDYERLFKEEHMEELRDRLRKECEIKKVSVTDEEIERMFKLFTQIYVSKGDNDDLVFIDPEKSSIFN